MHKVDIESLQMTGLINSSATLCKKEKNHCSFVFVKELTRDNTQSVLYTEFSAQSSYMYMYHLYPSLSLLSLFSSIIQLSDVILGVMQFLIRHIAGFMAAVLGNSPAELLNAAGIIFIVQVWRHHSDMTILIQNLSYVLYLISVTH